MCRRASAGKTSCTPRESGRATSHLLPPCVVPFPSPLVRGSCMLSPPRSVAPRRSSPLSQQVPKTARGCGGAQVPPRPPRAPPAQPHDVPAAQLVAPPLSHPLANPTRRAIILRLATRRPLSPLSPRFPRGGCALHVTSARRPQCCIMLPFAHVISHSYAPHPLTPTPASSPSSAANSSCEVVKSGSDSRLRARLGEQRACTHLSQQPAPPTPISAPRRRVQPLPRARPAAAEC